MSPYKTSYLSNTVKVVLLCTMSVKIRMGKAIGTTLFTLVRVWLMLLHLVVTSFCTKKGWRQMNGLEVSSDNTLLARVGALCNEEITARASRANVAGYGAMCEVNDVAKHRAVSSQPH